MVTNMYPSSALLGDSKDGFGGFPVDELIKKADVFADVFLDISIAVADSTNAALSASDILLTEPGLSECGHFANKCPSKKEKQSNLIEEDLEPTLLMVTVEEAPGSFINQEESRSKNGRKFHSASN
ncbi:hypothetical protein Tco_1458899 [Tanacetum coccineum]